MNNIINDIDADINAQNRAYAKAQEKDNIRQELLEESDAAAEYKAIKARNDAEHTAGWNEASDTDTGATTSQVSSVGAFPTKALPPLVPAKAMTFKETFAAQRKAGAKVFEWNGKKYTTEIAGAAGSSSSQKAKTAPVTAPVQVANKVQPRVVTAAPPPVQTASTGRTSAPSGRNYAHVMPAEVVASPARTSAPSGRNYAYVPDAEPKAVASPVRTSAPGSGRNYTPAPNAVRDTEDAQ